MEKAFEIQKQFREHAKSLNSYLTDLQNWETEMKLKEAALSGEFEQAIPPVRSKTKKEKPVQVKKKPEPRISASDYLSWEKFDVEKACEDVDLEEVGPASLDSKKSQPAKMEKLKEEAQHHKEKGNSFVKQEKWEEAIGCYNRAIELISDDAIYFANRGLCYLKQEKYEQAERDCSAALRLEPSYVKALHRRGTARSRRGQLAAAAADLAAVLRQEPRNCTAAAQLRDIRHAIQTNAANSKSSPASAPQPGPARGPRVVELESASPAPPSPPDADKWRLGVGENVTVLKPVKKPPHLRSKRPLKSIHIAEIPLGKSSLEVSHTRLTINEVESNSNKENNDTNLGSGDATSESAELRSESQGGEKRSQAPAPVQPVSPVSPVSPVPLVPPANSVQFMAQWKALRGNDEAMSDYFSIIDPAKIPALFNNALESDVLSCWVRALRRRPRGTRRLRYLRALAAVPRFSALAMFLSPHDKLVLTELLEDCRTAENCSDEEIADLKNKYEL